MTEWPRFLLICRSGVGLAADETVVSAPVIVEPAEVQAPVVVVPAEEGDEQAADAAAKERAREQQVIVLEFDGDFHLVVQEEFPVGEAEVGLEINGPLPHRLAVDAVLVLLQVGDEFQVLDLEIGTRDVLDKLPSNGSEVVSNCPLEELVGVLQIGLEILAGGVAVMYLFVQLAQLLHSDLAHFSSCPQILKRGSDPMSDTPLDFPVGSEDGIHSQPSFFCHHDDNLKKVGNDIVEKNYLLTYLKPSFDRFKIGWRCGDRPNCFENRGHGCHRFYSLMNPTRLSWIRYSSVSSS